MDHDPSGGTDDTLAATETPGVSTDADLPLLLLDRYRIGAVIGRGGMGEIYTARDEQIGRAVAIKRLRVREAAPELVARFLREARIQGRLDHPAIVPVHELCTSEGDPAFVMKQLTGTTLADVLAARSENYTRPRLLRAFVDVCLAIEFAHTRGVVHRDLKPANIMLGDFGEVYVLDWGIAKVAGDAPSRTSFADIDTIEGGATVAGTLLGTPGYMSPEQVNGDADLDGRGDVYALGCILYELLARKPLHPRGQAGLASALAGIEARPSAAAPDVPPELDAICASATARERERRFASARALGDAVQRFLDGDRDLAMRKDLAHGELDRAREALERRDNTGALRAAARALALDPQAREAAELVGRLMIEPPTETPPEVEAELAALEDAAMQRQAVRGGYAMLGYVAFFPMIYAAGIRDLRFLAAMCAIAVGVFASTRVLARRVTYGLIAVSIAGNAVLVGLVAHVTGPLLIAPSLAIMTAQMFAMHPRMVRAWTIYLGFLAAVLVPLAFELAGWVTPTTAIDRGEIVMHPSTGTLLATPTYVGLILFVIIALAVSVGIARAVANDRQRGQRALQLQSWQLRQLVPR